MKKTFTFGCLGFIAAFVLMVVIIAVIKEGGNTEQTQQTNQAKPQTLEEQIISDINKELGEKTNLKKKRIISVKEDNGYVKVVLAGDEGLNVKGTKEAQLYDATKVFPIIFKNDKVKNAMVTFQLTFTDVYGKEKEDDAYRIVLNRKTNDKIEWDNFNIDNFPVIADSFYTHPALNK